MIIELEQNRVRDLRKNPERRKYIAKEFARALTLELTPLSGRALIYRLLAITGTITGGYLVLYPEEILSAGNCRIGINVTRAPQGIEALLIGKDPRTGREIVRLNYPSDRLKEGTPVDSTTGRYEIDVSISTSTTPRRYSAPCGQAVNIPLVEQATVVPTPRPTEVPLTSTPLQDPKPSRSTQLPSWVSWVLGGLGGLIIGGGLATAAYQRRIRRAENERDATLSQLLTHETEVIDLLNREAQLTDAMNAAGVAVPVAP